MLYALWYYRLLFYYTVESDARDSNYTSNAMPDGKRLHQARDADWDKTDIKCRWKLIRLTPRLRRVDQTARKWVSGKMTSHRWKRTRRRLTEARLSGWTLDWTDRRTDSEILHTTSLAQDWIPLRVVDVSVWPVTDLSKVGSLVYVVDVVESFRRKSNSLLHTFTYFWISNR